ncbi:hypothetical protein CMO84_08425 [Candidatus Woesearchaeota archaeon]|nr:hypothetical protein [Candidatus Woesearchaeota archaeon]
MVGALSVSGLVSGLDTERIIQQLLAIERRPVQQLEAQQSTIQTRLDALRELRTKLSTLQTKAFDLALAKTVGGRALTTDTPVNSATIVSGTASSDAALQTLAVTVSQLGTATVATSNQGVGSVIDATAVLASAGFGTTVNTASAATTTFTLTTVNTSTGAQDSQTFSLTSTTTLNDVITAVNTQFGGAVTASLAAGTDGRASNRLQLVATSGLQLRLGATADTSNFLASAKLSNAVQSGTTVTSNGNLGVLRPTEALAGSTARLDSGPLLGTGSFTVNGATITWDASSDSLNDIISRINASDAKVSAVYDSINDTLKITANDTGNAPIAMQDVSGNFLNNLKLTGTGSSTQALGQTAQFTINGTSFETQLNQVTEIVPGVTLDLLNTGSANVNVAQDADGAVAAINGFIEGFNDAIEHIKTQSAFDADTRQGGVLLGDVTVRIIENRLRSIVSGAAEGLSGEFTSLADVGISTGRVGSAIGTTTNLELDEQKFREALAENPTAVSNLFTDWVGATALRAGGTGSIQAASGSPTGIREAGAFEVISDASGNLTATFTPSGGEPESARTGSISAGGTNETLIPGVTLTAQAALAAGTDYVDVTVSQRGVMVNLNEVLRDIVSPTGTLASRQTSGDAEIRRLRDRIERAEERLADKEASLIRRFAAIERALAQLEQQSSLLGGQLNALNPA